MAKKKRPRWYLPEWLEHLGLSQEELAARMGTSKGYLSDILTGKRRFNETHLNAIEDAIGVSPGDLLNKNPLSDSPAGPPAEVVEIWDHLEKQSRDTWVSVGKAMAGKVETKK